MVAFKKFLNHQAKTNALNHMIPQMIPAVAFSTYIGMGYTLDLSVALIALSYFGRLIWSISYLPDLINDLNELQGAFKRIEYFLKTPNVQVSLKSQIKEGNIAIKMKGNFSWGFQEKKSVTEEYQ